MLDSLKYNKADSVLKRTSLIAGYLLSLCSFLVVAFNNVANAYDHFAKTPVVNKELSLLHVELETKFQALDTRLSFSIAEQKESAFRTRAMDMRSKHGSPESMPPETQSIYNYWVNEADKYKEKMNKLEEKEVIK